MALLPVAPKDFEPLYEILHTNALWLQERRIVQWPLDWLRGQRRAIYSSVVSGHFFMVRREDDIAAVVELRRKPEALWAFDSAASIYVHKLAVNRRFNGEGIGRQVLQAVTVRARAEGCAYVRLDCVASNRWLRNYYRENGFEPVGIAEEGPVQLALYQHRVNGK